MKTRNLFDSSLTCVKLSFEDVPWIERNKILDAARDWCLQNRFDREDGSWGCSWIGTNFRFEDEEDAVEFKLKFG